MAANYDVLIATDLCGCSADAVESIAQEVEVQARLGLRTGLIHIGGKKVRGNPWPIAARKLVQAGLAEPVSPLTDVRASLLILRGPQFFEGGWQLSARAAKTIVVVDEPCVDPTSMTTGYRVGRVRERLAAELGSEPEWVAVGEVVRDSLDNERDAGLPLSDGLWRHVLDTRSWSQRPPGGSLTRGAIGRLGVDDYRAWPEDPAELEKAYPRDGSHVVRLLGGITAARNVIDSKAKTWHAFRAGGLPIKSFLSDLDVYVHFHHSRVVGSAPRGVLLALASGLPVITHSYLERELGSACHYGEASNAAELVRRVLADPDTRPNRPGLEWVRANHDWQAHRARLSTYLDRELPELSRPGLTRKKRVVFMSSNGTGMGHLTRLLAIARRLPNDCEALFLTLSTGLRAIREFGYWCDYIPSSGAAVLDSSYHGLLRARVGAALGALEPDALVFDGTFPYKGLRQALADYPEVKGIWSRRGMWKPVEADVSQRSLQHASSFDAIIEPGDFAEEDDHGATRAARDAAVEVVEPVVLLDEEEILRREPARAELGIQDGEVAVLLNLGAGNINRIDGLGETVARVLADRPNVHLFVLKSLIAKQAFEVAGTRVSSIEMYPLARVLKAFDFCIAAPGYNSFHELLSYAVPTVFIPNEATLLDDQVARAGWAARVGAALVAQEGDLSALERALERLLDAAERAELVQRCAQLPARGGGRQAAQIIAGLVAERSRSFTVSPLESLRPTLSKRLYRAGRWLVRRALFVRKLAVALLKLSAPGDRALPKLVNATGPENRMLVDATGIDAQRIDELMVWASHQPLEVIVIVSAELLPSFYRRGFRVELADAGVGERPIEERLRFAVYQLRKGEAIRVGFQCRDSLRWPSVGQPRDGHL